MLYFVAVDVTQATLQRVWAKDSAIENIEFMLVTADTSHFDRSWLKADVPENIMLMVVTADTFHADRSWLKADVPETSANMTVMLVTADTSHNAIDPCGPAEQLPTGDSRMHCSTVAWSSVWFWGANAAVAIVEVTAARVSGRG